MKYYKEYIIVLTSQPKPNLLNTVTKYCLQLRDQLTTIITYYVLKCNINRSIFSDF